MLEKLMEVLKLFTNTRRELGVGEIAELLGRPKSTVSGWLSAMEAAGFLERDGPGGSYRLSIQLAVLGELARRSTSLQRAALPHLERLARQTKETVSLNVLIGTEIVNVAGIESPRPILQAGGIGIPMPLHVTAAGKVLMAWRSKEEVLRLLPVRLERFTARSIVDINEYLEELERTRRAGYSVAWGEMAEDLFALSAPVRNHAGSVIGAITMGAPVSRIDADEIPTLARSVMAAAAAVSIQMGCSDDELDAAHGAPARDRAIAV
jgi:DNA-binding IclR family transcriptional regulator